MSDMDKMKLSDAMNYIDPDYIAEYESLSAYVSAKKAAGRRRINIATRVAASLAIIFTGVFFIMKDIDNGLIGRPKNAEEITQHFGNTASPDKSSAPGDSREPGSNGNVNMSRSCIVEDVVCEAPEAEISVTATEWNAESITLKFTASEDKSVWYTNSVLDVYTLADDGEAILFHSNIADLVLFRLVAEDGRTPGFNYNWGNQCGPLPLGRYQIVTQINDGFVTYNVKTTISISSEDE